MSAISGSWGTTVSGRVEKRGPTSTLTDTVLFNKETGTWEWTDRLCSSEPLFQATATEKDGKVYVWALSGTTDSGNYLFRSTEVNAPEPPTPVPTPEPTPEPAVDDSTDQSALAATGDDSSLPTVLLFVAGMGAAGLVLARRKSQRR